MSFRDDDISGFPHKSQFGMFRVEIVNVNDEHQKCRFQCRMIGHEQDQMGHPDENLQWYTAMVPDSTHRGMGPNPMYKPGDQCYAFQEGRNRILCGSVRKADPYEGEEADVNPYTLDGTASPKSPKGEEEDRETNWRPKRPGEKNTTTEARMAQRGREEDKATQGQKKTKNIYNRTAHRYGDKLSIGKDIAFKDTDLQNTMKTIQDKIQNSGHAVPELLPMVETLRKVDGGSNPPAIPAVGAGQYSSFIGSLSKYFSGLSQAAKKQEQKSDKEEKEQRRQEAQLDLANQYALEEEQGTLGEFDDVEDPVDIDREG